MKGIKRILILGLLTGVILAMASDFFTGDASGRAVFEKWSNRSARVLEPADYKTNGTCSEAICTWKGVGGIGNLGIGDGNVSLMKPEAIGGEAAQDPTTAGGPATESMYPDYDLAASVVPRNEPYSITVNTPFAHILAEDPTEAAALYGKLIGFTMPDGRVVDLGIKCIGYEY